MKLANQVDGATVRSNPRQGEPPPWQAHAPNTAAQDSLTLTHTKRFKPGTHNEDRRWLYVKIGRLLFIVATQKAQSTLHREISQVPPDSLGLKRQWWSLKSIRKNSLGLLQGLPACGVWKEQKQSRVIYFVQNYLSRELQGFRCEIWI